MIDLRKKYRELRWWWRDNNPYDWLRYRTWDRYHVVKCDGLKPGYHEVENQMLHSMFGLLREFVEAETAWTYQVWMKPRPKKLLKRSREYAIAHLDWAASLVYDEDSGTDKEDDHYGKPTSQAEAAIETKALYLWWVDTRPARPEPMVASGAYAAHHELEKSGYQWFTPCADNSRLSEWAADKEDALYKKFSEAAGLSHEIEERYYAEDEAMMKRLVAVRRSLWT